VPVSLQTDLERRLDDPFPFFLSGAAALAYEVLWTKWLTRVIGVTTFSVSTPPF
jgi:hypothetical protein